MSTYYCLLFLKRNTGQYLFIILAAITVFLLPSCTVTRQSQYFQTLQQKDTTIKGFVAGNFETKIVAGDKLAISVTSLNPAEDALFNSGMAGATAGASGSSSSAGYSVLPDGTVYLHRVGSITAAGLTRRQLATDLERKLLPYLKEPIVQVTYVNHKVTVLGEVGHPGIVSMPEEKLSVLDALVLSGDITANGIRNNVTIIRDEGNEKKIKHVNLQDNSIFSSDWYYLKPDDIVLVSADTVRATKEEKTRKLQTNIALVITGISFLLVILDRVVK